MIGQAGLGLPDRDYYLAAQFSGQRAAYFTYIAHILSLIGWEKPKEFAAAIITFETAIAEASWPLTERQDSEKIYNPMPVAQLAQIASFPWSSFFRGTELADLDRVVLAEASAIPKIAAARGPLYHTTIERTPSACTVRHQIRCPFEVLRSCARG